MTRLVMGEADVDLVATKSLRGLELKAKNRGDISSAILSAGYYARKMGRTMFGYAGNSYGSGVWRVSDKPSEYLNPINNTGRHVFSVTPDLTVARHVVSRPEDDLTPNASKLEWVKGSGVDRDGHSLTWWKNKAAKWSRSECDRPKVYIRVYGWDSQGRRDEARTGDFLPDDLKGAKAFAREAVEAGGSAEVQGRVEIPYQGSHTIELGQWRNTASNGFYVWSVDGETQMPVTRRGPFEQMDEAISLAKQVARGDQTYDGVVTFGGDPEAGDFEITKAFKAWSGEVHYSSDLPRVGGRLRELRR